jgi:hypothetical protein
MASAPNYTLEVLEVEVRLYEGRLYLACLVQESCEDLTGYLVTLFNATNDLPVKFPTGLDDFFTYDEREARRTYNKCLTAKAGGAA